MENAVDYYEPYLKRLKSNFITVITIVLMLNGCGSTKKSTFVNDATVLSDTDVCYNYVEDYSLIIDRDHIEDPKLKIYSRKLEDEIERRKLSLESCDQAIKDQKDKNRQIAVVSALVGAAALVTYKLYKRCKDKGDCITGDEFNGYVNSVNKQKNKQPSPEKQIKTFQLDYDWDGFYDNDGRIVFRCRSKLTGEFLSDSTCSALPKDDNTWPTKRNEPFDFFIDVYGGT